MTFSEHETKYMRRAIALARRGLLTAHPNPMVGAVIVAPDGRIIGEGWHRRCGEGHAEVNAVASVSDADRKLLPASTMYVSLEPCAHQGRTPSCARMLTQLGIGRVVVAAGDIFAAVNGRGMAILNEGGISTAQGLLEVEAKRLNCIFNTAQRLHRPWITLKWAQTADSIVGISGQRLAVSNAITQLLTHRLRAAHDAIIVGSGTVIADRPGLDNRLWPGPSPKPVILDRRKRLTGTDISCIRLTPEAITDSEPLADILNSLYNRGISSALVEGGPTLLQSFIDAGLYDAIRIETSDRRAEVMTGLPADRMIKAPHLPGDIRTVAQHRHGDSNIVWLSDNPHIDATHPMTLC